MAEDQSELTGLTETETRQARQLALLFWLETQTVQRGDMAAIAFSLGISKRTLQRWLKIIRVAKRVTEHGVQFAVGRQRQTQE